MPSQEDRAQPPMRCQETDVVFFLYQVAFRYYASVSSTSTTASGPTVPTTPKGKRTYAHLLEVGREVFARDGYVSMRMSDVASEAGISLGGLYRYFANKEDLFAGVIADLHERLFAASTTTSHLFRTDPQQALLESNRGYLALYAENREVMRAFMQAAHVDDRFRDIWNQMRQRHVDRFAAAAASVHGIAEVDGVNVRVMTEAVACMVEQAAYVWFAQSDLSEIDMDVDTAARAATRIWHEAFFGR